MPYPRSTATSFLLWSLRFSTRAVHVTILVDIAILGLSPSSGFSPANHSPIAPQTLVHWANLRPQYQWTQPHLTTLMMGWEGINVENHSTFLIHSADTVTTNSMFTAARLGQSKGPFCIVPVLHTCGEAIRPAFSGYLNFKPVFTTLQGLLLIKSYLNKITGLVNTTASILQTCCS